MYQTVTKTICTQCAPIETGKPNKAQYVTITVVTYQTTTVCPYTYTTNGVAKTTETLSVITSYATETRTVTVTAPNFAPAQATPAVNGNGAASGSNNAAGANGFNNAAGANGSNNGAAGANAGAEAKAAKTLTLEQTVVPVPQYTTQTIANGAAAPVPTPQTNGQNAAAGANGANSANGANGAQAASNANANANANGAQGASNANGAAGVAGAAGASGTGSASGVAPSSTGAMQFRGAASRVSGGFISVGAALVAMVMLL